jgi:chromosome partitioning protein
MAEIIAICNQKGGTGKTTTAVNLSAFLAVAQKRVLLVDLDPQGNATSGCGLTKAEVRHSAYDALLEDVSFDEIAVPCCVKNLFVAPSNLDLTGAEVELVSELSREYRLQKALSTVRGRFDFIFIDCPPSLGLLTINALSAADSVIIPVQCEYYALEGLTQLLNTVNLVKQRLNTALVIRGVLLTMADFRTNLTREVIEETREFFKGKVYNSIIPRNIRLGEAPSFGKPIFLYDRISIGCQKYWELCCEFLGVAASPMPVIEQPQQHDGRTETAVPPHAGSTEATTTTQAAT